MVGDSRGGVEQWDATACCKVAVGSAASSVLALHKSHICCLSADEWTSACSNPYPLPERHSF